ncbi:hypothetical protein N7486_007024 [Penicillium sp. IBT 16267x]|nr:hypothetical protein N7486_007024 [Penicillium sp. IBT 16267x]
MWIAGEQLTESQRAEIENALRLLNGIDHLDIPGNDENDSQNENGDDGSDVRSTTSASPAPDPHNPFTRADRMGRAPEDLPESEIAKKLAKQAEWLKSLKRMVLRDLTNGDLPTLREKVLQFLFYSVRDSNQRTLMTDEYELIRGMHDGVVKDAIGNIRSNLLLDEKKKPASTDTLA